MSRASTSNRSSLLVRTLRLLLERIQESFESPQRQQFRRLKKLVG